MHHSHRFGRQRISLCPHCMRRYVNWSLITTRCLSVCLSVCPSAQRGRETVTLFKSHIIMSIKSQSVVWCLVPAAAGARLVPNLAYSPCPCHVMYSIQHYVTVSDVRLPLIIAVHINVNSYFLLTFSVCVHLCASRGAGSILTKLVHYRLYYHIHTYN